jgi:hypothetical protein
MPPGGFWSSQCCCAKLRLCLTAPQERFPPRGLHVAHLDLLPLLAVVVDIKDGSKLVLFASGLEHHPIPRNVVAQTTRYYIRSLSRTNDVLPNPIFQVFSLSIYTFSSASFPKSSTPVRKTGQCSASISSFEFVLVHLVK